MAVQPAGGWDWILSSIFLTCKKYSTTPPQNSFWCLSRGKCKKGKRQARCASGVICHRNLTNSCAKAPSNGLNYSRWFLFGLPKEELIWGTWHICAWKEQTQRQRRMEELAGRSANPKRADVSKAALKTRWYQQTTSESRETAEVNLFPEITIFLSHWVDYWAERWQVLFKEKNLYWGKSEMWIFLLFPEVLCVCQVMLWTVFYQKWLWLGVFRQNILITCFEYVPITISKQITTDIFWRWSAGKVQLFPQVLFCSGRNSCWNENIFLIKLQKAHLVIWGVDYYWRWWFIH